MRFIVICQSIIGSPESGYSTAYNWDRERFSTRKAAISHGFKVRGSDDFNIGVLDGDTLTAFCWMDERMAEDLGPIAEYIGLKSCPDHHYRAAGRCPFCKATLSREHP